MNWIRKIHKSKTMVFALALVIFGAVEANLQLFQPLVPPEYWGAVVTVIGIIVAVLRLVTTKSLSDK